MYQKVTIYSKFKLGNDSFGKSYLDALKKENILTDFIGLTSEALTGIHSV